MENEDRKRGRPKGVETRTYQVKLPPDVAEWGKSTPEGLSGLLRRLLDEERSRTGSRPTPSPLARP